jgi:hypothetical protein
MPALPEQRTRADLEALPMHDAVGTDGVSTEAIAAMDEYLDALLCR